MSQVEPWHFRSDQCPTQQCCSRSSPGKTAWGHKCTKNQPSTAAQAGKRNAEGFLPPAIDTGCVYGEEKLMYITFKNVKIKDFLTLLHFWTQELVVSRVTQTQGFHNSSLLLFLQLRAADLYGRRGNHSSAKLSHCRCQDLPFHWGEQSLVALYSKLILFGDLGPRVAKQLGHRGLGHVNGLYCMFDLTENMKQLALWSPLCNVYKTIIAAKKHQQELSTS